MIYALLWVEALLASVTWAALWVSIGRWTGRRWVSAFLIVVAMAGPLVALVPLNIMAGVLRLEVHATPNWFVYFASLLLTYLVAYVAVVRGIRASTMSGRRIGLIFFLFAISLCLGGSTVVQSNNQMQTFCRAASQRVQMNYLALAQPVPDEAHNAAPLYRKAFAQLQQDKFDDVTNPPFGDAEVFDPKEATTHAFLQRQAGTLKLLRAAATRPCRFDEDLREMDFKVALPNLNTARSSANLLLLDARQSLADGDVATALTDAAAINRMSRHFTPRPSLVNALVGLGIYGLGHRALEEVLPSVTSVAQLDSLAMDQLPPLAPQFVQGLRGEERFGLYLCDNGFIGGVLGDVDTIPGTLRSSFGRLFLIDPQAYVHSLEQLQSLAADPYFQARPDLDRLAKSGSEHGVLMAILLPSLNRAAEVCARATADDECAKLAVAATRYRLERGTLPATLNGLVPSYIEEIPLDPFDGKPLRMVIKDGQPVIYSVGEDGIDDGGAEMDRTVPMTRKRAGDPTQKTISGDLPFIFRTVKPATSPS